MHYSYLQWFRQKSGSDSAVRSEFVIAGMIFGKFHRQQKVDNSCMGQTLAFRHTASYVAVLRPAFR
jgi:hypothetical protein